MESATESPDEFINSYMNMPFVSTLPDSVAQERLERLQRIISDTDKAGVVEQFAEITSGYGKQSV